MKERLKRVAKRHRFQVDVSKLGRKYDFYQHPLHKRIKWYWGAIACALLTKDHWRTTVGEDDIFADLDAWRCRICGVTVVPAQKGKEGNEDT